MELNPCWPLDTGKPAIVHTLTVSDFMNAPLHQYINHHLAGSSTALDMLSHLADATAETADREFYHGLHAEIQKDQALLKDLLHRMEGQEKKSAEVAGSLVEKVSRVKFTEARLQEESLELLEALEILVLGITGKKLLWSVLAVISTETKLWQDIDFVALEERADQQRQQVENQRLKIGRKIFLPPLST